MYTFVQGFCWVLKGPSHQRRVLGHYFETQSQQLWRPIWDLQACFHTSQETFSRYCGSYIVKWLSQSLKSVFIVVGRHLQLVSTRLQMELCPYNCSRLCRSEVRLTVIESDWGLESFKPFWISLYWNRTCSFPLQFPWVSKDILKTPTGPKAREIGR